MQFMQGDHFSGNPGNVREFDSCQGKVRELTKSQGTVREKSYEGKLLVVVSIMFRAIPVFISIVLA